MNNSSGKKRVEKQYPDNKTYRTMVREQEEEQYSQDLMAQEEEEDEEEMEEEAGEEEAEFAEGDEEEIEEVFDEEEEEEETLKRQPPPRKARKLENAGSKMERSIKKRPAPQRRAATAKTSSEKMARSAPSGSEGPSPPKKTKIINIAAGEEEKGAYKNDQDPIYTEINCGKFQVILVYRRQWERHTVSLIRRYTGNDGNPRNYGMDMSCKEFELLQEAFAKIRADKDYKLALLQQQRSSIAMAGKKY